MPRSTTEFVTYKCKRCGLEVTNYASSLRHHSSGQYCSKLCKYGNRIRKNCLECGKNMFVKASLMNRKKFCSKRCAGKNTPLAKGDVARHTGVPWNKGVAGVQVAWNKGVPATWVQGNKNPNWRGGKTSLMDAIRTSSRYKKWRLDIFYRDNYQCSECANGGRSIQAHHIMPLAALIHELSIETLEEALATDKLFDVGNGMTLCKSCHKKTDTYGVNFMRWKKQLAPHHDFVADD